jgi:hypothetical protein
MLSTKVASLVNLTRSKLWKYSESIQSFGLISEYNERSNKKLNGTHSVPDKQNFFVTSTRPGNFGDHIDFKVQIDNWFD